MIVPFVPEYNSYCVSILNVPVENSAFFIVVKVACAMLDKSKNPVKGGPVIGCLNTVKPLEFAFLPVNRVPFSLIKCNVSLLQYGKKFSLGLLFHVNEAGIPRKFM